MPVLFAAVILYDNPGRESVIFDLPTRNFVTSIDLGGKRFTHVIGQIRSGNMACNPKPSSVGTDRDLFDPYCRILIRLSGGLNAKAI